MGCDIHSMVEVKRKRWVGNRETVPGLPWQIGDGTPRWVALDDEGDCDIFPNSYYDPESSYEPFRRKFQSAPLRDRNYTLFALLADVRNGRGFAGVKTGDRINPLADPRGVPADASYGWLQTVDRWDVDMHSHTWFTLAELIEAEPKFRQRLVRTGAVRGKVYEKLKAEGGKPEEWSGSISGPGIRTVTPDEYDAGERGDEWTAEEIAEMRTAWQSGGLSRGNTIEEIDARLDAYVNEGRTYVQYVWEDSLFQSISELTDAIEALKRYAADRPPAGKLDHEGNPVADEPGWYGHGRIRHEDIRIVLGFDN